MYPDTIVVVRAGVKTTRAGDEIPDWSEAAVTRTPFDRVRVQPLSQAEAVELDRDVRTTTYRLLSEPGRDVDVTELDRVEWDGRALAVSGEVARYRVGGVHVEAVLELVEG